MTRLMNLFKDEEGVSAWRRLIAALIAAVIIGALRLWHDVSDTFTKIPPRCLPPVGARRRFSALPRAGDQGRAGAAGDRGPRTSGGKQGGPALGRIRILRGRIMDHIIVPALIAILSVAVVTDLKAQRIPNFLTLPAILAGLAYHGLTRGLGGLSFAAAGLALGLAVMLVPYLLSVMGGGDVKLMAAVGAWLGVDDLFGAFLFTCLAAESTPCGAARSALPRSFGIWGTFFFLAPPIVSNTPRAGTGGPAAAPVYAWPSPPGTRATPGLLAGNGAFARLRRRGREQVPAFPD